MKFKNKNDYLDQRNALIKKAEDFINEGKKDEADAAMEDVKKLDTAFEDFRKAEANLNALKNSGVVSPDAPLENGELNNFYNDEEKMNVGSPEYKNAWIHMMKGNKLSTDEQKVFDAVNANKTFLNEEKASEHTYIIPTTIQSGIWEKAAADHPVLQDMFTTHIPGNFEIIVDTSTESDADWVDETDESSDAEFTEGRVLLSGCELAKSVTVSWKLKKMNDQDYEAYLIKKLGEKVGNAVAKAVFHGKGKPAASEHKPQAKGFITALENEAETPNIIKYTGGITYKNMTSLIALIPAAYLSGASIYAKNTTIWNEIANILDANKRPIFVPDVTSGGIGKVFGVPVKAEDGVEEGEVAIGNLEKGYAFNFNEEMTIYMEDHVKARKTDYMAYAIADGDVVTTEAFGVLQKGE